MFFVSQQSVYLAKKEARVRKKPVATLQEKVANTRGWEGCHTHFIIEGAVQDVFSFPVNMRTICFISFILNIVKEWKLLGKFWVDIWRTIQLWLLSYLNHSLLKVLIIIFFKTEHLSIF